MTDLFENATPSLPGIHVGIGGWVFAPWRGGMFYPQDLVQRRELEYASRHVSAIEINGTYYGEQKPATYAKWRDETPAHFVFSAKAPKRITQSRKLAGTGAQIEGFVEGIAELGAKLGPLVWQFAAGKKMDRDDFAAFLALLPRQARAGRCGTWWKSATPTSSTPSWWRCCASMAWRWCSPIRPSTLPLPISIPTSSMRG